MFAVCRGPIQSRFLTQMKAVLQDHRSNIYSKPPKDKIGPGQSLFTLSVFAVALLTPAGWIMHHIPAYRKRPPQTP
ncbi:COX8 domain-containing protein [Osmerus eperlanus]|uniref:COX8 domain-containing protein n=1 Tax=Osmerus eperlanus TaxID=29151 RepID=UPI002E0D80A0